MDFIEFEKCVEEALDEIPKKFREILERENIQILPREEVPGEIQTQFSNRLVFGIFVGVPYNRRSMFHMVTEPTRIELYKNSFELAFNTKSSMKDQITKTVIHEIGHYFGFSERELRSRNL